MSLAQRIGALFAVLATVVITDNILLYRFFDRTADYGRFVNLANRQAFLIEKIELYLRLTENEHVGVRPALVESIDDFERSLGVLERGGDVFGSAVPEAPGDLDEIVARERDLWNELRPLLTEILESPDDASSREARQAVYRRASALIPELLATTFDVVNGLQAWRTELRQSIRYLGIASSVLAGLVLLGALAFAWKGFVAPVERLRRETLRVREKDLPEPSGDELSAVTALVSEMSTDVERLRSEREEVEEELRQVEADYQAIFENAVAGVYQFDLAGRLLLANAALAELLGYSSTSELIRSITNVHDELFADPEHRGELMAAADRSSVYDLETRLRRRDGSLVWVCESGRVNTLPDGGGYCEGIVIDVTPRKEAEESLRELSSLLMRSQEEERRRIARELHDSTGQMLAALEMNLDGLAESDEAVSAKVRDPVSSCRDLAKDCSRQVRSMSYLLHPPMLQELGLVYALQEFAEGFSRRSGIETELDLAPDLPRVPEDVELALFRVAQEALTNVHRHAESPVAIISLRAESNEIRLQVKDRGKGMPARLRGADADVVAQMGVGIRGMAERLKQLGGRLDVDSGPEGTTVEARIPVREVVASQE